jgi:hypothetical protein
MRFTRLSSSLHFREFWHGLTTPDVRVVKMAAVMLLLLVAGLTIRAARFRREIEAGEVDWRTMPNDFCRSSVMAASGAAKQTDPSATNLIFVGPSALRCWLPLPEEAEALASASAGTPIRVKIMCADRQSYACTSALIDRFGADFHGWFVIGVARQTIGRLRDDNLVFYRRQSRALCFDSEVLRKNATFLGYPPERATGWALWDHRAFYQQSRLGLHLPFLKRKPYRAYFPPSPIPSDPVAAGISPLNPPVLEKNLIVLKQVLDQVRATGRARVALVETPWVDTFHPVMQTAEWRREETVYQHTMREWTKRHDVPWITAATGFDLEASDFADAAHIGAPESRRQFLECVVQELVNH